MEKQRSMVEQVLSPRSSRPNYTETDLPEQLADPLKDRKINTVPRPFVGYPLDDKVFPDTNENLPDWRYINAILLREGRLTKEQVMRILDMS